MKTCDEAAAATMTDRVLALEANVAALNAENRALMLTAAFSASQTVAFLAHILSDAEFNNAFAVDFRSYWSGLAASGKFDARTIEAALLLGDLIKARSVVVTERFGVNGPAAWLLKSMKEINELRSEVAVLRARFSAANDPAPALRAEPGRGADA